MPRSSPVEFRQIAYAESSADGEIDLIVIDHPDLAEPLRFVRNHEAVVSNGETYEPFWFEIMPPELRGDGSFTQSRMQIDAVDQRMIEAIRSVSKPGTLEHFVVLISDPDTVAHGPWSYEVRGEQEYNQFELQLATSFEPVLQEQCPWKRLSPGRAPGLF